MKEKRYPSHNYFPVHARIQNHFGRHAGMLLYAAATIAIGIYSI